MSKHEREKNFEFPSPPIMRPPGEPFKVLFGSADHNANSPSSAPTSHLKLGLFSLPQELSFLII